MAFLGLTLMIFILIQGCKRQNRFQEDTINPNSSAHQNQNTTNPHSGSGQNTDQVWHLKGLLCSEEKLTQAQFETEKAHDVITEPAIGTQEQKINRGVGPSSLGMVIYVYAALDTQGRVAFSKWMGGEEHSVGYEAFFNAAELKLKTNSQDNLKIQRFQIVLKPDSSSFWEMVYQKDGTTLTHTLGKYDLKGADLNNPFPKKATDGEDWRIIEISPQVNGGNTELNFFCHTDNEMGFIALEKE